MEWLKLEKQTSTMAHVTERLSGLRDESTVRALRRERPHSDDDGITATLPKSNNVKRKSVVRHLSELVFGKNGGARYSDLESLVDHTGLSDFLPWLLYRQTDNAYLNTNNTVGYIWECTPLTFSGIAEVKQLESMLRTKFPKDTVMQFILHSDHDVTEFVDTYQQNKTREDPLVRKSIQQYSDYLEEGSEGLASCHDIPVRNFRLFVTLYSKTSMSEDLVSIVEEMLTGAHLNPRQIGPDILLIWLRDILNGRKYGGSASTYDENIPLRKQIIQTDTSIDFTKAPFQIGGLFARCLTPKANRKRIDPMTANSLCGGFMGGSDDAEQITSPFLLTFSIIFEDLKFTLHQKANMTMMQKSTGSFASAISRRMSEFGWALDKFENDQFMRFIPTIWVFDDDKERLRNSVSRVKRIWEGKDFVMQEEAALSKILFIAALPFGLYTDRGNVEKMDRSFIAHAGATARFVPIQADFRGSSKPVLAYIGRKGQCIGVDLFDERANNQNFMVAAESGSGKSFLLNNLCASYYAAGAKVRIADIGYSYQKLCSVCNGRFMDFGVEKPVINPFMASYRDEEDRKKNEVTAVNIVAEMAYSASGAALTETEWTLVKGAVDSAFKTGNIERGIDYAEEWLRKFPAMAPDIESHELEFAVSKARELAFNLHDFTSSGRYGMFFNGPSTFDISSDEFVVLELDRLKGDKELFTVVVMQVMNSVTQDLYLSDRSDKRFILFEEAASFLKQNGVNDLTRLAAIIEEGYRRARKYHGSFGVVLQSLLDLNSFGSVGPVLKANAAYKFLLQGNDYQAAIDEGIVDYKGFAIDLLTSVKNNKPRYSEMFLDTPLGSGVARLSVDKWNYWIATSAGAEVAKYNQLVNSGLSPIEAISECSGIPV